MVTEAPGTPSARSGPTAVFRKASAGRVRRALAGSRAPTAPPARVRPVAAVVAGAVPWCWFALRDVDARLDALAIALPVVAGIGCLVLLAAAVLGRRWPVLLAAASWSLFGVVATVGPWVPVGGGSPAAGIRVVEANVRHDLTPGASLEVLLAQAPDVLVVDELGQREEVAKLGVDLDSLLKARFAASARNRPRDPDYAGDVGVYSRWPIHAGPLPATLGDQRGLRVVVDAPSGSFVLFALHLDKPAISPGTSTEVTFPEHRQLVDAIRRAAGDETLPTLVVGDLNLVDRTSGYRALRRSFHDGLRADWVGPTSRRRSTVPLLARIDHVFVPRSWCSADAGTFELRDSDHRGVATTVGPCG